MSHNSHLWSPIYDSISLPRSVTESQQNSRLTLQSSNTVISFYDLPWFLEGQTRESFYRRTHRVLSCNCCSWWASWSMGNVSSGPVSCPDPKTPVRYLEWRLWQDQRNHHQEEIHWNRVTRHKEATGTVILLLKYPSYQERYTEILLHDDYSLLTPCDFKAVHEKWRYTGLNSVSSQCVHGKSFTAWEPEINFFFFFFFLKEKDLKHKTIPKMK